MPFPNEHSCRVREPSEFQKGSFRRKNIDNGVDIIIGRPHGKTTTTTQSYRFDAKKFTVVQAKAWLKRHSVRCKRFEAATGEKNKAENYNCEKIDIQKNIEEIFGKQEKKLTYKNIINYITNCNWLATEESVNTILSIIEREINNEKADLDAIATKVGHKLENSYSVEVRDGIAIIPIKGTIFRYANLFTQISGASSLALIAKDLQVALDNEQIKAIILDIDSPGGEVNGISEFASMIFEARNIKPIYAYVGGSAASGAYWIASAAEKIIISETAILGSIGVVISIKDKRQLEEKSGIRTFELVSRQSPFKRNDPATEEGREQILKTLDSFADIFISSISLFRNIPIEKIKNDFGQGGIVIGKDNIKKGMADEIKSFENLINNLSTKFNTNEGSFKMSEKNNNKEITKELIQNEYPQISDHFFEEGAEYERNRIKGVEKLRMGHEKLIDELKFDGVTTPEMVALKIIEEDNIKKEKVKEKIESDAAEIENVVSIQTDPKTEDEEILAAMSAGANSKTK